MIDYYCNNIGLIVISPVIGDYGVSSLVALNVCMGVRMVY